MSNNDNLKNSNNQNNVGETSNNFVNEKNSANKKSDSKEKAPKKLSKKELALKDIEALKIEKQNEQQNKSATTTIEKESLTKGVSRAVVGTNIKVPTFRTKKELEKQVRRELRKNKDLTKLDVLNIQERQLRAHLRKLEEKDQERREEVEKARQTMPEIAPQVAEFVEEEAGSSSDKSQSSSIKSLDDLILVTQASKRKKEEEKQRKAQAEYIAELTAKRNEEKLHYDNSNFLEEKQTVLKQLEKIEQSREEIPEEESEKRKRRGIFWWIIILLLTAVVAVMGYFVMEAFRPAIPDYISINVKILNGDVVFKKEGTDELLSINTGDSFPLRVVIENLSTEGKDLYVRFKVALVVRRVDDVEVQYPQYINVYTNPEKWIRYNEEKEQAFNPRAEEDDFYNYYVGILEVGETLDLLERIEFDYYMPDEDEDGQKFAGQELEIVVTVETIDYFNSDLSNPSHWETAPREWINEIATIKEQEADNN